MTARETTGSHGSDTILVTGSVGLLGSALLKCLKERGYRTAEFAGDIVDGENVRRHKNLIGSGSWIIHTAAMTDVNQCEMNKEQCFRVNVEGTRHIRNLARTVGAKLVYISTVSVFSGEKGDYCESDLPYPKNYYSLSKYLGEQLVAEYEKGLTLRLNLIGIHHEGSRGLNFLEWLYDSIKQNKDLNLFTDVLINPLSNWTLADIINSLIRVDVDERIMHLGSSDIMSKAEVAQLLISHFPEYCGKATFMSVDEISKAAFRPKEMWLNIEHAQEVLGIKFPTLAQEIEKIFSLPPIK